MLSGSGTVISTLSSLDKICSSLQLASKSVAAAVVEQQYSRLASLPRKAIMFTERDEIVGGDDDDNGGGNSESNSDAVVVVEEDGAEDSIGDGSGSGAEDISSDDPVIADDDFECTANKARTFRKVQPKDT